MLRSTVVRVAVFAGLLALPGCGDGDAPLAPTRAPVLSEAPDPSTRGKPKFVVARTSTILNPSGGAITRVKAWCPEGSLATGGGHDLSNEVVQAFWSVPLTADDERPLEGESASGWEVGLRNNGGASTQPVTVFVICSN